MAHLFDELKIRDITFHHRVVVSPMCQYSCVDGFATDWHLVHLGSRAVGGAALVIAEASAVLPEARISPQDLGIWSDKHIEPLARITRFLCGQGAIPGIQLAHAGRKASTRRPWDGAGLVPESEGGWREIFAPSPIPFDPTYGNPEALTKKGIAEIVESFAAAARRAVQAGFQVVEIHAAHGYLLHEFLSPLSNRREDEYGGSFDNRTRVIREVVSAIREEWPERYPLFVRISATDWAEGGWDLPQSIELVKHLIPLGADLIDCSSGGLVPHANIPIAPGYQVPFAEEIRKQTGALTAAVGMITSAKQADDIVRNGQADMVLMAREFLRRPYWPLHAAEELGAAISWPPQYLRAARPGTAPRQPIDWVELDENFAEQHAVPDPACTRR